MDNDNDQIDGGRGVVVGLSASTERLVRLLATSANHRPPEEHLEELEAALELLATVLRENADELTEKQIAVTRKITEEMAVCTGNDAAVAYIEDQIEKIRRKQKS